MIIDASALLAILLAEEDAARFARAILAAPARRVSAASYLEAAIRLDAASGDAAPELDALLEDAGIEIVPVSEAQARLARTAWRSFGKGRHPARLNFGDCLSYALARAQNEPLLYKGGDFALTDIPAALGPAD